MGILLDIGFVIIILLCVVFGYKKGFFKSIAGFIGAVIAMFLAWVLAGLIANTLYQGIFREKLIDNIPAVLSNDALASFPEKAAQVVANLPGFLSNTLNNQGITSSQIEQSLQAAGIDFSCCDMAAAIVANCHFVLYFGDIGTLSNKINRQCISFAGFTSGRRYTGRFIWHI